METYQFPNANIILYMYEPLFSLRDCSLRNKIYNTVIENLQKINKKIQSIFTNCQYSIDNFILKDIKYGNLMPFERTIKVYESL